MEDISQLRSRVAAAQQRMTSAAEEQQKYGLRLADVARIVEGALARQKGELDAAIAKAASCEAERDVAVKMVAKSQAELEATENRLSEIELRSTALAAQTIQMAAQNEQLRGMVMTLLQLIESRSTTPMSDALQQIEAGLRGFLEEQAPPLPQAHATSQAHATPQAQPAPTPRPVSAPVVSAPVVPAPAVKAPSVQAPAVQVHVAPAQPAQAPASQTPAAAAADDLMLMDINDGPDEDIGSVVAEPAGESSPVAELIRRISEETEEISPPAQRKA